jgi:hypothetical protein
VEPNLRFILPFTVEDYCMITSFNAYSAPLLSEINATLTQELRNDALAAGWPSKIVSSLTVTTSNFNIVVNYDQEFDVEIGDLEYGTQDSAPRPVFRLFIDKHSNIISDNVADSYLKYLEDAEVF